MVYEGVSLSPGFPLRVSPEAHRDRDPYHGGLAKGVALC